MFEETKPSLTFPSALTDDLGARTIQGEAPLNANDLAGGCAAYLASVEVALGAAIHGLHIPFGGHVLSLHQLYILQRRTYQNRHGQSMSQLPWRTSLCVALLKTLSPAGKKLTPMLAITMQGFLCSLPMMVLGINIVSLFIGALLTALWGFVQPLLLTYLFYGDLLVNALNALKDIAKPFEQATLQGLVVACSLVIGSKLGLSIFLARQATRKQSVVDGWVNQFALQAENRVESRGPNRAASKNSSAIKGAIRDSANVWMVLSFLLTGTFLFYSDQNVPLSVVQKLWLLLRPFGFAFVLFYAFRKWPLLRWVVKALRAMGFQQLSQNLESTLTLWNQKN